MGTSCASIDEGELLAPVARPRAVPVAPLDHQISAAAKGRLVPMEDIPDPVFASGAMGAAVGIWPVDGYVYAPVDGTVTIMGANMPHAMAIRSDDEMVILVHVGIDTVEQRGDGFVVWALKGMHVCAGDPLMWFDTSKARADGRSDIVVTSLANADRFGSVVAARPGAVEVGDPVLTVGGLAARSGREGKR